MIADSTFEGRPIVNWPDCLPIKAFTLSPVIAQASQVSPWTGSETVFSGQNNHWRLSIELEGLTVEQAKEFQAFVLKLKSPLGVFRFSPPVPEAKARRGKTLTLSNDAEIGDEFVSVSGFPPNMIRTFSPGDFLSFGQQLLKVVEPHHETTLHISSHKGVGPVNFWPPLRRSFLDGATIDRKPSGLFVLQSPPEITTPARGFTPPVSISARELVEPQKVKR